MYLYSVLILLNLTIAVSDSAALAMLLAFTVIGGFMPLKEYVDSRCSNKNHLGEPNFWDGREGNV